MIIIKTPFAEILPRLHLKLEVGGPSNPTQYSKPQQLCPVVRLLGEVLKTVVKMTRMIRAWWLRRSLVSLALAGSG